MPLAPTGTQVRIVTFGIRLSGVDLVANSWLPSKMVSAAGGSTPVCSQNQLAPSPSTIQLQDCDLDTEVLDQTEIRADKHWIFIVGSA